MINSETAIERKEREHREDLARLRGLRPIDDDFMRCMFKDNIPLAQYVLRVITEKDDLEITRIETQRDMKRLAGARSVCLDAYGNDSQGRKYDLEIQRSDHGAGVYRARYHSSAMDIENLDAGQKFEELPETYTIFITENDYFCVGKPLYHIERVNLETNNLFNDGEHIIYVNGQYRDDSEIGKLMHDFFCSDPNDMKTELMRDTSRYYKENPKGVDSMCRAFEDLRNESISNTKIEIALKMLQLGKYTIEEVIEITGLTKDQVMELAEAQERFNYGDVI